MTSDKPDSNSEAGSTAPREPAWFRLIVLCRWPLAFVALALIAFFTYRVTLEHLARGGDKAAAELRDWRERGIDAVRNGLDKVGDVAARFKSGTITKTFTAAIPEIERAEGGRLELATAKATETFRTTQSKSIAWDWIHAGTTVSEIRVPVTYRYHLELSDRWVLDVNDHTCVVIAPSLQPSLPPAIHTDEMKKRTENGWARFNKEENLEELEKSITPLLKEFARDPKHTDLVREECRLTVAQFVKNWLLKEEQWTHDRFQAVQVFFPDEVGNLKNPSFPEHPLPSITLRGQEKKIAQQSRSFPAE